MSTESQQMLSELKTRLVDEGAALVGVADLDALPSEQRLGMPRGLVIGVALAPEIVEQITDGPTAAYSLEYEAVNERLNDLTRAAADYLADLGFRVERRPITADKVDEDSLSTALPNKTVATLAGLGWIGKCALLVTQQYGSAVRLGTVLTDAPLPPGRPVAESRCGACRACAEACPAGAPSGREWTPGMQREEFFDAKACFRQTNRWAETLPEGHQNQICGLCIAACPYTKQYLANR